MCSGWQGCSDSSDRDPAFCAQWTCTAGYWKCANGLLCVADKDVCNGFYQCNDGSDEDPVMCAQRNCLEGKEKCADGLQCIDEDKFCDAFINCRDFSDICVNRSCPQGLWKCKDGIKCIEEALIMNGYSDCIDLSDEDREYLRGRNCTKGYSRCNDAVQCIRSEYWCDGLTAADDFTYGCQDGSDEGPSCKQYECPPDHWRCADEIQCIKAEYVCDGKDHDTIFKKGDVSYSAGCKDGSDELNELCCVIYGLSSIAHNLVCDGSDYCNDKSDEQLGVCENWDCGEGRWKCNNFKCIDLTEVCDGIAHCNDTSDEQACANWTCAPDWHKCRDGFQCIADESVCDGKTDCPDLFDEDYEFCMEYQCLPNFVKCANDLQCIKSAQVCDGEYDCLDISDEQCDSNCLKKPLGDRKAIIDKCVEVPTVCIPVDQYCDGVADCPDGSDERRSDCSCEGWGLTTVYDAGIRFCLQPDWCSIDGRQPTMERYFAKTNISETTKTDQNLTGKEKKA